MALIAGTSLHGSTKLSCSNRLAAPKSIIRLSMSRAVLIVNTHRHVAAKVVTSRRAMAGLVGVGLASECFLGEALADVKPIKIGPPPPPSGGLPGTLNSDQPRDLQLPYKQRFYLQPLMPAEAAKRAKESAKDIVNVKEFIDKKAWPYVQNALRLKAEYLRYDLNTVISAKPKDQKKELKELTGKLFQEINNLDYAAKIKSTPQAEKYYAKTLSALNDVLDKLG